MKTYFDQHPNQFRLLFLVVTLPILTYALRNTYRMLNRGSAENEYQASQSRLYVAEDITGVRLVDVSRRYFAFNRRDNPWIRQGDLIVAVNGKPTLTSQEWLSQLAASPNRRARIRVQRPTRSDYFLEFEAPVRALENRAIWEIPPTVYVWGIAPGGASYRAGIRRGDLIHEINQKTFQSQTQADALVDQTLRGQTVDFGIIRKNRFHTIKVTMARLTIPLSLLLYYLVGFLWLAASLCLGLMRSNLKAARLLAWGFFLVAISLILYGGRGGVASNLSPHTVRLLSALGLFLGIASLVHAHYYFPRENRPLLRHPLFR